MSPARGRSPLDPFIKNLNFLFSRRGNKKLFFKKGVGEVVFLLGFSARAEPKVLILFIILKLLIIKGCRRSLAE